MPLFGKRSIGLDIADYTIEMVELVKSKERVVSNLRRISLKQGIVERGRIKNKEKLIIAVRELFKQAKPKPIHVKKVNFALPESQIYTHIIELGSHDKSERNNLISQAVKKNIPLKEEELVYSHKVLSESKDKRAKILVVVVSRQVIEEWQQFFKEMDIEVDGFDIETLAVYRGLEIEPEAEPVCIVDIGALTTNISIFNEGALQYSYTINVAGEAITNEIQKKLNIKIEEAEKKKIEIDLSDRNNRIIFILIKSLQPILFGIAESLYYYKEKNKRNVNEVILVGGSSKLKGVVDYFKANLKVPVRLGLKNGENLGYVEALGLAVKDLYKKRFFNDLYIPLFSKEQKRRSVKDKDNENVRTKLTEGEEKEESSAASKAEKKEMNKVRGQKITLAVILLIGALIIAGAFWYRNSREIISGPPIGKYNQVQSFDLKVKVVTDVKNYSGSTVRGRIIEDPVGTKVKYSEALAQSKAAVEEKLNQGESLWKEPINLLQASDDTAMIGEETTITTSLFRWLVYSDADAKRLFILQIDELNKDNVYYILGTTSMKDLSFTDDPDEFYLTADVVIFSGQFIGV